MKHIPTNIRKKRASALLTILLTATAIGSVALVVAKSIIDLSHQQNNADASRSAFYIARSGIEEGLLRYRRSPSTLQLGEYGDNARGNLTLSGADYSLKAMRRGFKPGTNCLTLGSDVTQTTATGYDPDCPYYDLAVRTIVALPTTANVAYSPRELPLGKTIVLNIPEISDFVFPVVGINTQVAYTTYSGYDASGATVGSGTVVAGNAGTVLAGSIPTIKSITFTVQNSPLGSLQVINTGSGILAIGKGYTTIDTVGYVGDVERRMLMTVREQDGNSPDGAGGFNRTVSLVEFAQSFNDFGVIR